MSSKLHTFTGARTLTGPVGPFVDFVSRECGSLLTGRSKKIANIKSKCYVHGGRSRAAVVIIAIVEYIIKWEVQTSLPTVK